jgi:hypothetical protein
MARREWQNPNVLQRESAHGPEWYIRYRVKVLDMADGKPAIKRVEKWRTTQRYIADDVARRADAAKGLFVVGNGGLK